MYATDLHPRLDKQLERRCRAARGGIVAVDDVQFVRCDARHLPFADHSVDAIMAVSTLEHVVGLHGDRLAVGEIARVLRPGGRAWITVPYRHAGSMIELDDSLDHFQWHYSPQSIVESLLADSGMTVRRSVLYGERFPFYDLLRRSPPTLQRLIRPWSSLLSAVLLHVTDQPEKASAVMLELESDSTQRT